MMSWTQQVTHVFLKDVHATRWLLFGYAALLVLGIVEVAAELRLPTSSGWPLGSLALRAMGGAICASIVLADAPFNPRSHWASLPYARSAILAAKGLMVCILLLFTAVALLAALQAFQVPLSDALRPAVTSLVGFVALLTATALIASVERTLISVAVMLVLAFPALLLLAWFLSTTSRVLFGIGNVPGWVALASLCVAVAVALALLRVRRVRTVLRVGVLYAAVVLVGVQFMPIDGYAFAKAGLPGVPALAELVRRKVGRQAGDETVFVSVRMRGLLPSQRVDWLASGIRVASSNGSSRELGTSSSRHVLNNAALPLPANLTWLGASPLRDAGDFTDTTPLYTSPTSIILRPVPSGARAVVLNIVDETSIANVASVSVRGKVEVREPRVFGRLPLTNGARIMREGRRITVLKAGLRPHPELRIDFESVLKDGRQDLAQYTFVLVNNRRGEAVRMAVPEWNHHSDSWLLAPAISARVTGVLRPAYYGMTPAGWQQLGQTVVQFDGAWLQESELVIIEWELVGSLPVAAELPAGLQ